MDTVLLIIIFTLFYGIGPYIANKRKLSKKKKMIVYLTTPIWIVSLILSLIYPTEEEENLLYKKTSNNHVPNSYKELANHIDSYIKIENLTDLQNTDVLLGLYLFMCLEAKLFTLLKQDYRNNENFNKLYGTTLFITKKDELFDNLNINLFKCLGSKEKCRTTEFKFELACMPFEKKELAQKIIDSICLDLQGCIEFVQEKVTNQEIQPSILNTLVIWCWSYCLGVSSSRKEQVWNNLISVRKNISEEFLNEFNDDLHNNGYFKAVSLTKKDLLAYPPSCIYFEQNDFINN